MLEGGVCLAQNHPHTLVTYLWMELDAWLIGHSVVSKVVVLPLWAAFSKCQNSIDEQCRAAVDLEILCHISAFLLLTLALIKYIN